MLVAIKVVEVWERLCMVSEFGANLAGKRLPKTESASFSTGGAPGMLVGVRGRRPHCGPCG